MINSLIKNIKHIKKKKQNSKNANIKVDIPYSCIHERILFYHYGNNRD
jgi:hypothetical protein